MIQRKQTVFLLLAVIMTVICLCMPLGSFTGTGILGLGGTIGSITTMYNLWLTLSEGTRDYSIWMLFAILLITCSISVIAIFSYHNRIVQSRFCMFNMLLVLGWYIVYAVLALNLADVFGKYCPSYTSVFPAVSFVLYFIARKAILADEALVRAADRIR